MCRKSLFPACLILTFGIVNITLALGLAIDPYPPDGAIHPDTSLTLSWTPGDFAVSHDVYFGADYDAVANADTSDPEGIYRTSTEENSYVLPEGSLEWGQTYFWRIDEINPANPDSPWTGDVWSFTVTASDFYYNGTDEQIALSTAVDYLAVRLEPRIETESFIDLLQGLLGDVPWQRVDEFPQYRTVLFWFGEEPSLIDREHLEQVMLETGQVEVLSPVFRTAEEAYLLILTDEFLARFHPEIPLKQIEALNLRLQTQIVEEDLYEENKFLLKLLPGAQANVLDIANIYHNNNMTVWAAPNFLSEVHKWFVPNDPYFKEQWHLENTGQGNGVKGEDVDAVKAWDHTRGDSSIVIAIIDDGVDYNHEDLAYNIFENLDEASYNNIDDDNNGYTNDDKGWDFYDNDNDPMPSTFNWPYNNHNINDIHGTPCAGVAAACINNKIGVSGMSDCKILPIKVFGGKTSSSFTSPDKIGKAIKYASTIADVLSMSWGHSPHSEIADAMKYAADKGRGGKGAVILVASGNGYASTVGYPARLPTVIAVGASTNMAVRASYSNYGNELDIVAPSSGGTRSIYTTDVSIPNRGYDDLDLQGFYTKSFGGTSSATPLAAGVAALILSLNPDLLNTEVQTILQDTADKIDATNAGYDASGFSIEYGYGRVNAYEALQKTMTLFPYYVWYQRSGPSSGHINGITYGNNTFVTVGAFGWVNTSPTGINWTGQDTKQWEWLNDIAFGKSQFVAVGYNGVVLTSPTGATWTWKSQTSGTSNWLGGVHFGNNLFIAVGAQGTIITSTDGTLWNSRNSGTSYQLNDVSYGNGLYVAVGDNGTILTSPNGVTWTSRFSGTSDDLEGVTYGNNLFIALGDNGAILPSSNGVTWMKAATQYPDYHLYDAAYAQGVYIAVGSKKHPYMSGEYQSIIISSTDGSEWKTPYINGNFVIYGPILEGVTYGNGCFVAVGRGHTILQSGSYNVGP